MELPEVHVSAKALLDILELYVDRKRHWDTRPEELKQILAKFGIRTFDSKLLTNVSEKMKNNYNFSQSLAPVAHTFNFDFENMKFVTQYLSETSPEFRAKWKTECRMIAMFPIVSFLRIPDLPGFDKYFGDLIKLVFASRQIVSNEMFTFCLSACVVHYISDQQVPFSKDLAVWCFGDPSVANMELLEFVMCSSLKGGDRSCFEYLADLVLAMKNIEDERFSHLLDPFLGGRIEVLDSLALKLVIHFSELGINQNKIKEIVQKIPEIIFKYSPCDICFVKEKPPTEEWVTMTQKLEYKIDFEDSFPDGFSPIPTEVFEARVPFEFPSPSFVLEKTIEFLKDLKGLRVEYLSAFFEAFKPANDTMFVLMLYLMEVFKVELVVTPIVIANLLQTSVFCYDINVFVEHSNYSQALAAREYTVDFLIKSHPNCIPILLEQCSAHVLFFAEMIGRIHAKLSLFDPKLLTDDKSIASLLRVMGTLKRRKSDDRCQKARATIYIFLFAILDDIEVSVCFFSSLIFVSWFLPCVFQPSLCTSVLSACSKFLNNCRRPENVEPTVDMLCALIDCCDDEGLVGKIVVMIANAVDADPKTAPDLTKLVASITGFLRRHPTKAGLSHVIKFYSHASLDIDRRHLVELTKLIKDIDGPTITDDTVLSFLCMMAKTRTVSLGLMVLIERYYILIPFLSLFSSSSQAKPVLDYLMRLCRYSPFNCRQCHRAELDLLLMEMIMCREAPFSFRGFEFHYTLQDCEDVIEFIGYMLSIVSSAPVAIRAIQLMCVDSRFLAYLNSCLLACKNQNNIIPIGGTRSTSKTKSIQSSRINSEFSVQFWLRMDSLLAQFMNSQIILFSIIDSRSKIELGAQGGSIVVKVEVGASRQSAMLSTNFPTNTWSLVTIGFKRNKEKEAIIGYSLGDSFYEQYSLEIPDFESDRVKLEIGSMQRADALIDEGFPVFMSGFRVYGTKLTLEKIRDILGKKEDSVGKPVFVLDPERNTRFSDILDVFACPPVFHSLLPVMYYFDSYSDGFPEMLLDFVGIILTRYGDLDVNWKLVAHLLGNCKLTYSMYLRFFGMLDFCRNKTLDHLIDHILLNFELWTKCEQITRIVQHWGVSLPEACAKGILNVRPFSVLMAQICHYFYFVKSDPEAADQIPDLDVELCRQNLNKLALALATLSFTESDAMAVISHVVNTNDLREKLSILDLLWQIARNVSGIPESVAGALFFLLKPQTEPVFLYALKIIYSIRKQRFVGYSDAIIELMNQSFCTRELFDGLIEMIPDYPLVFPIMIYVSIHLGDQEMQEAARVLKTMNVEAIEVKKITWLIMSLNLAVKLYPKYHDILVFVSSVILFDFSMNVFDSVISIIIFYGSLIGFDLQEFAVQVTKVVADFQIDSNHSTRTYLFLRCVIALMVEYEIEKKDVTDLSITNVTQMLSSPHLNVFMYSKLPKPGPIMETARRLYSRIEKPSAVVSTFGRYLDWIAQGSTGRETEMPKDLRESLDDFWPAMFIQHRVSKKVQMQKHAEKLDSFWKRTRRNGIDFCSKFTETEACLAAEALSDLRKSIAQTRLEMQRDFKRLRKLEMNEFSMWKEKKMFFSEVRRCFRYNTCLSQVRLRKGLHTSDPEERTRKPEKGGSYRFDGKLISIEKETPMAVAIGDRMLQINNRTESINHVRDVLLRYRSQHRNSVEIIMTTGQSYFIELTGTDPYKMTDIFSKFKRISRVQTCKPAEFIQNLELPWKWAHGLLSNFQYLMMLNILGGRSFKDTNLYPIFPWVLKRFDALEKALEKELPKRIVCSKDSSPFEGTADEFVLQLTEDDLRDMSWPIAAQTMDRREELLCKFDHNAPISKDNCIFFSTPSNSTTVAHWLVRQPPYTQLHIKNEDGTFGVDSRLFRSWSKAVEQVLCGSGSWELLPEMYCQPEVLVNLNGYDRVGDVYPIDKAIEFVYYHRKILESPYVSEHLNEWIDLIFGDDASNPARCSIYTPILYETVWDNPIPGVKDSEIEQALRNNGQLPAQLFNKTRPHPKKQNIDKDQFNVQLKSVISNVFDAPVSVPLTGERVKAASLLTVEGSAAHWAVLDSAGTIHRVAIDFETRLCSQRHEVRKTSCTRVLTGHAIGALVVAEGDSGVVVEVTRTQSVPRKIKTTALSSVAVCREAVSVCNRNGEVVWWFIEESTSMNVSFVSERVLCHAISTLLGVVVFATSDGYAYICDIVSNQVSFRCDLEGRCPKKVLVATAMGYIAVYCDDFTIMLFTCNGHFIREVVMSEEVIAWQCFSGRDGFDYLIVGDARGNLRLCELFYLDFAKPFHQVRSKIVVIDFDANTRTCFVVTEDKEYLRIPLNHNSCL